MPNQFFKDKNVSITRATGFVGQYLTEALLNAGADIEILTRKPLSSLPVNWQTKIRVISGGLLKLSDFSKNADYVFHLAVEQYDKKIMRKTNVLGTKILLEHLGRNMKIKKFIFLSSVGVFGQNFIKKIIGEEDECRPQNLYEKTKFEAETYVKAKIQNGFPAIIIRPSIIYGPRAKSNNNFYRVVRAINRGYFYFIGHQESFYNIIYIEDVIKAILDIAQIENTENTKIFTVNESIEWRELISLIQKHLSSNKKIYTLPKILGFILSLIGSLFRLLMLPAPLTHTAYKILTCQSVYQTKNLDEISKESDKIGHRRGIDKTINYMKSAHIL